jgi:hypothetical protein
MAIIATSTHTKSNVVKQELWAGSGYVETQITVNDTAGVLLVGTVLGKVTATGKYKRAVESSVDGSKVAAAVVVTETTILGATDTAIVALTRGPAKVSKAGLVLDATYNDDTKKGVVYASLESLGVQVLETV